MKDNPSLLRATAANRMLGIAKLPPAGLSPTMAATCTLLDDGERWKPRDVYDFMERLAQSLGVWDWEEAYRPWATITNDDGLIRLAAQRYFLVFSGNQLYVMPDGTFAPPTIDTIRARLNRLTTLGLLDKSPEGYAAILA